jgi:hypothetical protein
MKIFLEAHLDLLRKMIEEEVDFLVIGGYAVNYYGYNRYTDDLDIWLQPGNSNRDKLISVFSKMGFETPGLDFLKKKDFHDIVIFNIWERPFRVDFLTRISGVEFHEAYVNKSFADAEGLFIPVIGLNHLILSKISTSRLRDKSDVQELQNIMKLKTGET